MDKKKLLLSIKELGEIYKSRGETFRAKAYDNGYFVLINLDEWPNTKKDMMKIKGLGKGLVDKIFEFKKTGEIKKLNEMRKSQEGLRELTSVDGIGPKIAKKFVDKGITNVKDLKKEYEKGLKLTDLQKLGLTYYDDLHKKIPRIEISRFENKFKNILKEVDNKIGFEIMGSYRRGKKESGDIDILLYHPEIKKKDDIKGDYLQDIINKMNEKFEFCGKLAKGEKKYMGLYKLEEHVRHIDLLFVPMENLYAAINYFTGSKEHNVRLRAEALRQGYTVNEYRLQKGNKIIPLNSEKELFDILGMKYIKPEDR